LQSMAPLVRDLEQAALVHRRPDPEDGRRALVELTPAGIETLRAIRARREDWLTQTLDEVLDAGERERLRAALELLRRIADA
jgi:DNA-binding MarR family transcriptional regulator